MTPHRVRPSILIAAAVVAVLAGCGGGSGGGADSTAAATLPATTLPPAATTTTATPAPTSLATTLPPTTVAPTTAVAPTTTVAPTSVPVTTIATAPPTTLAAPAPCATGGPIASGATGAVTISGDVDGDVVADAITAYALDGVPHVHAVLSALGESDAAVPIGFSDTVTIAFEDIDHSAGLEVPPPFVVSAVGAGNAGSAWLTFLSPGPDGCLRQWDLGGTPFVFRVSQQGPYAGLVCDGAAGSIHYTLDTVDQNADGTWTITTQQLTHSGTTAIVQPLDTQVVPDDTGLADQYGNILGCGQAPPIP